MSKLGLQIMLTGPDGATEYPNRTVAFAVEGFDRLALSKSWPFIELVMSPKILALAKSEQQYTEQPRV